MKKGNFESIKSTNVRILRLAILTYGLFLNLLALFFPTYGTERALAVFLTTRRSRAREEEEQLKRSARRSRWRQGKHRVVFYSWGQGPAVLLVHGWNGRGTQLGSFVPPLLEQGFRVVTFDGVGHGDSEGKRSTLYHLADGIRLAEKIAGPFHGIITHSMGGAATTLALQAGIQTKRLVFISPPYHPPVWIEQFTKMLRLSPRLRERLQRTFEDRYGDRWEILTNPSLLRPMNRPLLVIHDKKDSQVPWQEGEIYAKAWSGAKWIPTEGLGHNRILRNPEVIRQAVAFVKSREGLDQRKIKKGDKNEKTIPQYLEKNTETDRVELWQRSPVL